MAAQRKIKRIANNAVSNRHSLPSCPHKSTNAVNKEIERGMSPFDIMTKNNF